MGASDPRPVNAIAMVIQACSAPGEGGHHLLAGLSRFARIISANDRRMVASPLRIEDNRFHMDIAALEASLTGDERILLLCSPHNPGGRYGAPRNCGTLRHSVNAMTSSLSATRSIMTW